MSIESVLFVDDEDHILEEYEELFEDQKFKVQTINSPNKALELISSHKFEVLISDHKMPEMSGIDLITKVRQTSPDTVRIILTGYANKDLIKDAVNLGDVFRFLEKPCQPENLIVTVLDAIKYANEIAGTKNLIEFRETYKDSFSTMEMFQSRLKEKNSEIEMLVSENETLSNMLEDTSKSSFKTLANLISMKSTELFDSAEWVSNFSIKIAEHLNLSENEKSVIYMASYLRDIGKLTQPDSIMLRPKASIKPSEIREYYKYPIMGEKILRLAGFKEIASIVSNLLERFDGSGPNGKSEKEISISSQIISIANDTYDSLLLRSRKGSNQEIIYGMASMIKYIWSKSRIYYTKDIATATIKILEETIQGRHQDLLNLSSNSKINQN